MVEQRTDAVGKVVVTEDRVTTVEPGVPSATTVTDRVWTIPNALSFARLVLVPVFLVLVLMRHDVWAWLVLAFSGVSDYLDGKLARRWNQVSRVGALLDPAADRLYIIATLIGLTVRGIVPWWLTAGLVARDLVLATTLPVLRRHGYGPLPVHFLGKAATANLLYAFPLLLLGDHDGALPTVARVVGWAFAIWGTALYWWAGLLYLEQVRRLVRPDRAHGGTPQTGDAR
ncbi:MAG: CDP-alcohol phosphatidyltransferase family protein [Actinomycetales bacterium]